MNSAPGCLSCQTIIGEVVPPGGFIHTDDTWTVSHALPPTSLVGWLILQPRRHIEALAELSASEQVQMSYLMAEVDGMLRVLLSAKKVYVCLFAESAHCPHVHFHIIPRTIELDVRGPAIFTYEPSILPSEEEILDFVQTARDYLVAKRARPS